MHMRIADVCLHKFVVWVRAHVEYLHGYSAVERGTVISLQ
jgi:hypothetical protein